MGGSQLKQLKSSLRASGLSRTSNPKDEKKRAKQRKDLSSSSLAHRNSKLGAIHDKFNLFDVRDEKKKFEVVTRRGEVEGGKKGMPGKARAAGIETRKKTLLPMLDARTHSSTFLDHRFGETSTNLTPEEKALERFTAERQSRLGKKAKFNLEDDDEGGFELTHGGRTLGFGDEEELENGGWGGLGVSEGANREPLLKRRKMGAEPEEEEPERKKTHAEIMDEVVAKSKFHKAERKRMRSADDETRLGLDADLKDLRSILGGNARMPAPSRPAADSISVGVPSGVIQTDDADDDDDEEEDDDDEEDEEDLEGSDSDDDDASDSEGSTYELNDEELEAALAASSAKSGVDRDLLRKLIGSAADRSPSPAPVASTSAIPAYDEDVERPPPAKADEEDKDPYDNYVRMLALEPRAHATNRMKTPLELAQQAAEELKAREEKRLKRQRGERDDSSDEEGGDGKKDKKGKGKRVPQADDLDDDFLAEGFEGGLSDEDAEEGLGKGLEGIQEGAESEEEEEADGSEGDEDDSDEDEGEEEEEDDEMDVGDLSAEDSDEEAVEGEAEALVAPTKSAAAEPGAELPFTFPCPSTHGEFVRLLTSSNIKEEDTPLVVKRIRTLYHPGLAVGNKEKIQVFANVLLDHVIYLAVSTSPTAFRTINSLLPPLLTLSHAYPLSCAPHYVSKLRLMHKNFLRGLSKGPLDPTAKTWPGLAELTLLRVVGMVWSMSDLSHPVSAAAQLLIGEYLAQARVRNLADLASGLFLCTLSAQYEQVSQRLTPESTNFILSALLLLLPTTLTSKTFPGNFPTPDFQQEHAKSLKLRAVAKGQQAQVESKERLNLLEAVRQGKSATSEDAEQVKADLVKTALALLTNARERYSGSEAFVELFQPAEALLKAVKLQKLPAPVKEEISTTVSTLTKALTFALQARKPLALQHHRAIPIATYLPKFDEGFNPNRRFDPDTERAEQSKLRALYKKEKKGAVRELRKDNRFLAVEEAKRKKTDDAAYEKKITKIMGSLQDERAEEKAFEREKSKGKRRDKARRG
ncbi:nucleolar 14 family protein [Sporobolomyces koalae]|uniref:nucleolar 14 family protein n=1 Tax=Sporobolomyces koalae TaxID=500713 RepID=UPI00316C0893